jgi:hypothetical protein
MEPGNITQILEILPLNMAEQLISLINLFKAIGITLLIYLIFLLVKSIFLWKDHKRIKEMQKKIDEIHKKLIKEKKPKQIKSKKSK